MSTDPISRLVRELGKLPGIGQKTATRLAFHVLRAPAQQARDLAQALLDVKEKIRLCSVCMNLTEQDPCALCADPRRDPHTLCVVAHPSDLIAVEPPELIGGDVSVTAADPKVVSDSVEAVRKVADIPVLCGAGVKTGEDVRAALDLGAEGVLLASGVVKAKDVAATLRDLVSRI